MIRKNFSKNIDWATVFIYLLLVLIGWISIYSSVHDETHQSVFDFGHRYGKQMVWIIAAFLLALVSISVDTRFFYVFSYLFYALSILLLIAVLFLGIEVNSSKSWFNLGFFQIQPSEFAKLSTSLVLARFLSTHGDKINNNRNLLKMGGLIFLPIILILLQPDVGSATVFLAFFLALFREGLSPKIILAMFMALGLFVLALLLDELILILIILAGGALAYWALSRSTKSLITALLIFGGILVSLWVANDLLSLQIKTEYLLLIAAGISALPFTAVSLLYRLKYIIPVLLITGGAILYTQSVDYIFDNVLQPHHQTRINTILGIESDPLGEGYNINQSKIAIGSGGLTGKGFLQGTQTRFNFVPEQSTDFIFCTIGEEWGFLGSSFIIILFVIFLLRILYLAERQRSVFSRVFGYSLLSVIFYHFAINIGMTIGIVPVVGLPLPFVSYGGSSLWSYTLILFIFLKMDAGRTTVMK